MGSVLHAARPDVAQRPPRFFNWESKRKQYRQKRADPELSRSRWWWIDLKVLAFAALVGLCAGLATAWLAQLTLEKVPRVRAGCQQAEDVVLFPLMLQGRGPEGRELTKAEQDAITDALKVREQESSPA